MHSLDMTWQIHYAMVRETFVASKMNTDLVHLDIGIKPLHVEEPENLGLARVVWDY